MNNTIKLLLSILITVGIGSSGGFFTIAEIPVWYASLVKPSFNPPNWLFGPVWTTLYTLMGISLYLVWKQPATRARNIAIGIFAIQFTLNFFWSLLFFKQHQIGWALAEIILMWLFIVLTIFHFWKQSKMASFLLWPYLCWVSFATMLNASLYLLNR